MLIVNKATLYYKDNYKDKFRWNFIKFLLIEDKTDFDKVKDKLIQVYIKTYEKIEDYHYKKIEDIENYIKWLFYHKSNDLNKNIIIVAIDNDSKDIVGFIAGDTYYYDKELEDYVISIHEISVIPEYQGLKIGYSLMNEFLEFSKQYNKTKNLKVKYSNLYVGEKNLKAINFYKKLGYTYFSKHGKWIKMIMYLE